ncbi:hypothetical protein [Pseudomonas aeruginosa]|uniref:hypothetical protein n=1 Tax=Pseudomonas aeruginosa TaxID=287 RepID=UPI001F41AEAF|nr:hypothetical protein [Pseudomonas aeruginosa]EKX2266576.1 hypothetical protein [Pseudomonas aeruginosa]MCF1757899.1 hypothetical protein [Pseudomonas aeruginosa]MCO7654967.1 hypothetical protein [Pseudomonas aeruginosa]MDM4790709.1 hypothetical protein [Pseudomonas aeruginosa]MDM4836154.1 hypothetical protein [Pseudomonas aeruginosa]
MQAQFITPEQLLLKRLEIAFAAWAKPRGYDLAMCDDGNSFLSLETRNAWLGFEAAHGSAGCRPVGQQLYALLKKSSPHAHQTDKLFAVRVGRAPYDDYVVHGGPGGVYRLSDVNFYVIDGEKKYRLG